MMSDFLKKGNVSLNLVFVAVVVMALLWRLGNGVVSSLKSLTVYEAPSVSQKPASLDVGNLPPVWVKQAKAIPESVGMSPMDVFFRPEEKPVEKRKEGAVADEYMSTLKRTLRLDAVSDNGAFLNGRFYKVGSPLEEFAKVGPTGALMAPRLTGLDRDTVTVNVLNTSIVVKAGK